MASNVVLKSIDLASTWTAISAEPLIADITLVVESTGTQFFGAMAELRSESSIVPLLPGRQFRISGVDLSTLEVRSAFQDLRLLAIGNTR